MDIAFNKVYCRFPILFFCVIANCSMAQTISGEIRDTAGHPILSATLLLKDSIHSTFIKEFGFASNGKYLLAVKKSYRQLTVEINAPGYQPGYYTIHAFEPGKTYTHNFYLARDTIPISLQEVIVTAKKKPFQIKGDTVTYNVSAYRNGTERKIQDVIKKLPGIEVNEKTGEIKYKGRSVETVKLDGEDLFSSNYSVATKNINADMIEQVQAIEHYSNNPLLKGIEDGDKVALNLVVKNKKADYSGSADLGTGVLGEKEAVDASANVLGISAKYKSFATASYNNISVNNTPFDYFSYTPTAEQVNDAALLAKRYMPDTYFDNSAAPERSNITATLFSSYNAVFKVGKKLSLKTNVYYQKGDIQSSQSGRTVNNINGLSFTTSDVYTIHKKPALYRGDIEATWNTTPSSLLQYSATHKIENIRTPTGVLQNDSIYYTTELTTKDVFTKQTITYTKKISGKKAIQLIAKHSVNDIPQDYQFTPAIFEPSTYVSNNQQSRYKKSNTSIQSAVLGSAEKSKYAITMGAGDQKIIFNSQLTGNSNNIPIGGFANNNSYHEVKSFANGFYQFTIKHIKWKPAVSITYVHQSLSGNQAVNNQKNEKILLEPSLSVACKLSNFSGILINAGLQQHPFSEEYYATNPVYISSRVIQSNQVDLTIQQSKTITLFYVLSNLYKQLQVNFGSTYSENRGNYFPRITVQQNTTALVYFFLPESNKLLSVNSMIEKYIPFLQGTFRLKSDYARQWYKNIVNNSSLRNNISQTFSNELFFRTAFDGKINIENTVIVRSIKSESGEGVIFKQSSLMNKYQVITKPFKRFFVLLSADYYLPDISGKKQHYIFFDADIDYQTKNKLYGFRFRAGNISNNKVLTAFSVSDYSTTSFQTNLLPRHFEVSVSRSF